VARSCHETGPPPRRLRDRHAPQRRESRASGQRESGLPEHVALCQRVLAIPARRVNRGEPTSLTPLALAALLDQPDRSTRKGRRDVVLLSVLYDTGARVQELIDLRVRDVRMDAPATVQLTGKGRKTRLVPLLPGTARLLGQYLREEALLAPGRSEEWLFRNQRNGRFSRWGVRYLMQKYCDRARATCSAFPRRVTPHSLRHSKAIHLLQAGNPTVVIRDILGHADIQSTEIYARVDLEMKRRALEKAADTSRRPALPPWHRKPDLLLWLESI